MISVSFQTLSTRIVTVAYVPDLRRQICPSGRYEKLIVHTSNFRPVKREAVVDIFRRIRAVVRSRSCSSETVPIFRKSPVSRTIWVESGCLHPRRTGSAVPVLSVADLFLLPSQQKSFGLAALEAMACEVPSLPPEWAACRR